MGNKDSSQLHAPQFSYEDYNQEFEEVSRSQRGIILLHRQTCQQFFLKEWSFGSKTDYQKQLQSYHTMKRVPHSENVLSLVKVWAKQFTSFCSHSYKIYVVYQYPEITLRAEIDSRKKQQQPFDESDLWSIAQSCVNALLEMTHELSLTPENIFILGDGVLKVMHEDIADFSWRRVLVKEGGAYYAPQKLEKFNNGDANNDLEKEAVFGLGMTLLEATLLQSLNSCYDYEKYKFKTQALYNYLSQIEQYYSPEYAEFLNRTLNINPKTRASLKDMEINLTKYWEETDNKAQSEGLSIQNSRCYQLKRKRSSLIPADSKVSRCIISEDKVMSMNFQSIEFSKQQTVAMSNFRQQKQDPESFKVSQSASFSGINYCLPLSTETAIKKDNDKSLFTDPQFLESIKKDLQAFNQSQRINFPLGKYQRLSEKLQEKDNVQNIIEKSKVQDKENSNNLRKQPDISQIVDISSIPKKIQFSKNPSLSLSESNANLATQRKVSLNLQCFSDMKRLPAVYRVEQCRGQKYQGLVINGKKQGYGRMTYQSGSYYEGAFRNNKIEGIGKLYSANGSVAYDGQWKDGKFNGRGILYNNFCTDNQKQSIDFQSKSKELNFENMEIYWTKYQGEFQKSLRHGLGKLYFVNGDLFSGQFYKDKIQGQGKYIFADKKSSNHSLKDKIEGVWIQNKLQKIIN